MKKSYQVIGKNETRELAEQLARNGQFLLPMVELVEQSRLAVDELIDGLGRAHLEAVLLLSAQGLAGEKHQGRRGGREIGWHGWQRGVVPLAERRLRVEKPRLRRKGQGRGGEVEVPAYEALNRAPGMGQRVLEILLRGVSTRHYQEVLPEMAETVGVSKSAVSREFVEASEEELKELAERRLEKLELLIIYLDGLVFGEHHVIAAVGVDAQGHKQVLGLVEGASENGAAAVSLLEDLVRRGVDPRKKYLFVVDGAKALRSAIDQVFGKAHPVQRCRSHKVRNVCAKLPKELQAQTRAVMKGAYRLAAEKGLAQLKKQAKWLEREHPGAAASLREGLEETFTINRLNLPPSLLRCLGTTNVIENSHGGVRQRTRRVSHWQTGNMALRWAGAAFLAAEKRFRRVMGYRDLWMLQAALSNDRPTTNARCTTNATTTTPGDAGQEAASTDDQQAISGALDAEQEAA